MDLRRLEMLLRLSQAGSMREVAEDLGVTTSTVSQQIAALAREAGTPLLEPVGRRVRLTPAGQRLADHAVTILAAVHAATSDLDPAAEPAGTVRVAGFATAIRRSLVPLVSDLSTSHPLVQLKIHEHEPLEALRLLMRDEVDLVLTYDYNLAPVAADSTVETAPLWSVDWGLGVLATETAPDRDAAMLFHRYRDSGWIVNSRNTADEEVVRTLASMAGFAPVITHRVDSLELVQDLIRARLGVGLLPLDQPTHPAVAVVPLHDPAVTLRACTAVRRGRARWAPLALVLESLQR
ncbi:MAG: LysR family transcriptional regulator [Nocardioides sp.]